MCSHPSVEANVSLLNPIVPALAHWRAMRGGEDSGHSPDSESRFRFPNGSVSPRESSHLRERGPGHVVVHASNTPYRRWRQDAKVWAQTRLHASESRPHDRETRSRMNRKYEWNLDSQVDGAVAGPVGERVFAPIRAGRFVTLEAA